VIKVASPVLRRGGASNRSSLFGKVASPVLRRGGASNRSSLFGKVASPVLRRGRASNRSSLFGIPESAELITLNISGKGDINYQLVKRFNVILPDEPVFTVLEFEVEYDATDVAVNDIVDVHAKVKYIGRGNSTGMLILDVAVPTGFTPVVSTLDELKTDGIISRYEIAGRKIILYVDDLPRGEELLFDLQVQAQFPVKAIIPDSYSYYNPKIKAESVGQEIVVV